MPKEKAVRGANGVAASRNGIAAPSYSGTGSEAAETGTAFS
jgi:hypothetical protein